MTAARDEAWLTAYNAKLARQIKPPNSQYGREVLKIRREIPTLTDAVSGPGCALTDPSIPHATGKYPPKPDVFIAMCKQAGLPTPTPEYRFHATRKWRFDYAIVRWKVAIEIDGGVWIKGGAHSMPTHIARDMEKGNAAALQGWKVLRYEPSNIAQAILDLKSL